MRVDAIRKCLKAEKSLEEILGRCNEYLVGLTFTSMFVIGVLALFMRYVVGLSLTWADEVNSFLLVWLTFLGASVATRQNTHISLNMNLLNLLPRPIRLFLRILLDLLLIGFLGVFIVEGSRVTIGSRIATVISLPSISMAFIYGILPASALLMMFYFVHQRFRKRPKGGEKK